MIFVVFLKICFMCRFLTSRSFHISENDLHEMPKIPKELIERLINLAQLYIDERS